MAAPIIVEVARAASVIASGRNGTSVKAPGAQDVFALKTRAFIPAAWVRGVGFPGDFCVDSNGTIRNVLYAGDNRSYDPFLLSYRAESKVAVSASFGAAVGDRPLYAAGTTTRYSDDAVGIDGYTLRGDYVYGDCHLTDYVKQGSVDANTIVNSGGYGIVNAELVANGTNVATTFPDWTPPFHYDFTYTINAVSNPSIPAWTLQYNHKCFPAYEAYIGTQLVYGYKPKHYDAATISYCLAGGGPVNGSALGTVN